MHAASLILVCYFISAAPAEPPQKKPHTRGKNLPTPGRRADPRVLLERAYAYHDAVMGTTRTDHTYAHAHAHARVIAEGEHLAPTHPAHTHAHAHTAGGSIGMAQATQNASKNTQSGGGGIEGGLGPDSTAHVANGAAGEVMAADVNSTTHAANDVGGSGSVGVGETVADGTSSTSLALHGMGGGVLEEAASAHKAREAETVAKVSSAPAEEQTGLGLETDETLDDEIVGEMSETGERDSPEPASGPVQKDLDSGAAGVGSPLGTTLSASVEAEKEERERDGVQGASHSMGVVDYSSDEDEAATTKNAPDKSADGPIPNKDTVPVRTTAATDTGTQTVEKGTVAMETTEVTTQTADRGIGATKDAATTPETSMTSGATGVAKAKSPVPETARPVVPGVSTMAPFETSRGTTHEATGPSAPETSAPGPTKTGTVEGIAHVGTETASGDSTGPSKGHIPNGSAGVQESNGPIPKMSQPIPIAKESAGDTAAGVAPAKQPTALPSNGKEPSVNGATYTSSDGGGQKTETNDVGQDESLPDNCPDQPGYFLEG
ncbi:hypothetical protein SARC_13135 [Sphaeroforma arctica JP610]|uniref:Uncharacterized protein n=1 Tax=Sphaeroforma arctica JP610 TaxID=667725 RepID=A0A0L0FC59_9EUKA|nr:hypothetical protein SARC_13135 [Sphaeroforma arctica JP610]KNC74314.1 hypothetical protein SARC_13135 [Sphaeroforma arctica JP610]|eukprot:XP_014148216.1 hypothetical protein SARC_13135 [Sphaeroforma arctica JP610]